jgi:hypothetical protein
LHRKIDFVFANAGIVEGFDFYASHGESGPPPEPTQLVVNVDLKAVINTTYLALHYFRLFPRSTQTNILMTGSVGSLYPCYAIPMYSGSKRQCLSPAPSHYGFRAYITKKKLFLYRWSAWFHAIHSSAFPKRGHSSKCSLPRRSGDRSDDG